jgi:hypothetical protein
MIALTRGQRAQLLFLSASAFTAWFAGLGAPLHAEGIGNAPVTAFSLGPPPPLPRIGAIVVRDPFAGRALRENSPQRDASHGGESLSASAEGDVRVPDIESGEALSEATRALVVRATIVGPNPVAYVSDGNAMDIVRVGDALAERHVAAIDLHGVAFNDGTRLDLPEAYTPHPRAVQKRTIALEMDDLRRMLAPLAHGIRPAPTPLPSPSSSASAPATDAFPSPGPLPTIDARGLPVGVNPTPDAHDATPFPNPYPYAPASHL